MKTSYLAEDITILLKDVTGMIAPEDTLAREEKIQGGVHYSEMLPMEYQPSESYLALYEQSLKGAAKLTAEGIKIVAEKIWALKGQGVVLVSLVRAGLPVGILIKHYLERQYGVKVPHYGVSIIRGRGIDHEAMAYILARHKGEDLQFVDGWTGKGAILRELEESLAGYGVSAELAVLADPAWMTDLCGTHEDFLIPSACLNATVSGLISRSILNQALIKQGDFHGAVYYGHLAGEDQSYAFISTVEEQWANLDSCLPIEPIAGKQTGMGEVQEIAQAFGIADINMVKPGIGETTRVLLRRVPWKILINPKARPEQVAHILRLAKEKEVPVVDYPLAVYNACGLIKNLSADV